MTFSRFFRFVKSRYTLIHLICHSSYNRNKQYCPITLTWKAQSATVIRSNMSKFEWQTEDDWQDEPLEQSAESPSPRRWLFSFGFVALLALVGTVVFIQLRQTVNETTGQIEQDISAAFELLHDSAENSDIELFSTYLSGRDREWTAGYQQLVGAGSLIERDALRLDLRSERPEIAEVVLNPDLRSAVLTATTRYAVPIGNGLSQTIALQQPYHFRRGETRWLFAPPETDYWGGEQFSDSSRLLYTYPLRDEKLVLRLMRDIDEAYDSLCRHRVEIDCIRKWQINFETTPMTLASVQDESRQVNLRLIDIPTPTLVGLPPDEDSYRALRSGYAHLILTAIFAEEIGYVCCEKEALFHALVDQISAELGLRANLDAPEHFQLALQYTADGNWPFDWDSRFANEEISLKVNYTTVTFLRQQYRSVSTFEMLALLPRYADRTTWMQQVIARIDSTANSSNAHIIWEANYASYQNWLGQRLDSYAAIEE